MKRGEEADLQKAVMELAERYGWRIYHPPDNMPRQRADGSTWVQNVKAGFPDLVLIRPPVLAVAEFKAGKGRVSVAQQEWLDAFASCGIQTFVWRPQDFEDAHRFLRRAGARL